MAEYDWMVSAEFKNEVRERVKSDAGKYGMEKYETVIGEKLIEYLEKYKSPLIEAELKKASYLRKTKDDSIRSIDKLMEYACDLAKKENRKVVQIGDFEKAYEANFCMLFPFCGKME
jgi:hypothetical protein